MNIFKLNYLRLRKYFYTVILDRVLKYFGIDIPFEMASTDLVKTWSKSRNCFYDMYTKNPKGVKMLAKFKHKNKVWIIYE